MEVTQVPEEVAENVESTIAFFTSGDVNAILKTILTTVVLLVVCLIVKSVLLKGWQRVLDKSRIEKTLHGFLRSTAKIVLWFVTIIIVAGSLGIDATSLIAVLSVAGLAVSLSIQGSLSNLASGITILLTRPFVVGDYVDMGDTEGTVKEIGMIYTKLNTVDNRRVILPNSAITSAKLINYSAESRRRVDITVAASYDAPLEEVRSALMALIAAHPKTLQEPDAPTVHVEDYGDNAISYTIRVWCATPDYWDVRFDLIDSIKGAFDQKGVEMSYPHVNVHMVP